MPPKEPRRKKTDAGPMSRSLATSLGGYVDPASSLLKGRVLPELQPHASESEQRVHRGLQQLSKVNATTKIKGLAEVEEAVVDLDDGIASMYVLNLITSLKAHLTHESAQVRAGFYTALTPFLTKEGKEVKRQVVDEIGLVVYCWLCGMCDVDRSVREAAHASFVACFPIEEKRKVSLERSFEKVQKSVLRQLACLSTDCDVPVRDEEGDVRILSVVSGLGLVGYLLRNHPHPGEVQTLALSLLQSRTTGYLRLALPLPEKTVLVSTSPKVRGAAASLLTTIVTCKVPLHQKDFGLVWATAAALLDDPNPALQAAGWELTLQWLGAQQQQAVAAMPNSFVGLVLNKIENLPMSQSDEGVEALLSSLLPYATVLSREPAHCGVVDDICGELIERVKAFGTRPLGREYRSVWKAAWELWELHVVRKSARGEHDHSLELLAVMLAVSVEAIAGSPSEGSQRLLGAFQTTVIPVAAKHLLKCMNRLATTDGAATGPIVNEVLQTLVDKGAEYRVLAHAVQHRPILLSFAVRLAICFYTEGLPSTQLEEGLKAQIQQWTTDLVTEAVTLAGDLLESDDPAQADALLDGLRDFFKVGGSSTTLTPFSVPEPLQHLITERLVSWSAFSTDIMPFIVGGSAVSSTPGATNSAVASFITNLIGELQTGLESLTVQGVKMAAAAANSDAVGAKEMLDIIEMGIPGSVGHDCLVACFNSLARKGASDPTVAALVSERRGAVLDAIERTISDLYLQGGEGAGPSTVVSRNLTYNNESSSSDSDSGSDGSTGSSSASDDDSDSLSREVSTGVNMGRNIFAQLMEWMDLLASPSFAHAFVLGCYGDAAVDSAQLEAPLMPILRCLHRMIATVTPLLHGEQFISLRLLRFAITSPEEATQSMSLVGTMSRRHHALPAPDVEELLESLEKLAAEDWGMPRALDCVAADFFSMYFLNVGGELEHPALAASMLGDLVCKFTRIDTLLFGSGTNNFVSGSLVSRLVARTPNVPVLDAGVVPLHTMIHTIDGACAGIRLGQLASLLARNRDVYGSAALIASNTPAPVVAGIITTYVRVCALRGAVNDRLVQEVRGALHEIILSIPAAGSFVGESEAAFAGAVWALVAADLLQARLLGALGKELGVLIIGSAESGGADTFATPSLNAVCEAVVSSIATLAGPQHDDVRELFALTTIPSTNNKHHCVKLQNESVVAIKKALVAPATSLTAVITLLLIFRLDRRYLVITDDESMSLMGRIQKGRVDAAEALGLLAELSCHRNTNVHLYTELCRAAIHWASQNYALHHLPTNGRLGNRPPTSAPLPLRVLRPSVRELIKLSQGLDMHNRRDDALQGTINLVVFDAACECIYRIRDAQAATTAPSAARPSDLASQRTTSIAEIVSFVASVLPYLGSLNGTNIRSIAASEQSSAVISNALAYVHMWLCSSTVAQLEAVGVSNILHVVSLISRLALVALASSKTPVHDSIHLIRRRCLVKKLRVLPPQPEIEMREDEHGEVVPVEVSPAPSLPPNTITTSTIVKLPYFKRIQSTIAHTTKQKISVLTYLSSWLCTIGTSGDRTMTLHMSTEQAPTGRYVKNDVFQLMDLIVGLLCTPINVFSSSSGRRNPDDCYLLLSADVAEFAVTHGFFGGPLGFDTQALSSLSEAASQPTTNLMSSGIMNVLAQGAATLYCALIQSPLLVHVRDWLNTVDNSVRILLTAFTSTHLSPVIVQNALLSVMANDVEGKERFEVEDDYWVTVSLREKKITLDFEKDDSVISLAILFPAEYPLNPARLPPDTLKSQSKNKVGEATKWRKWVMKISVMLFDGHTKSVWSSVQSFGRLLQQHFDGVDPCPICYSLMDTAHKLPNMSCSTCGNRCHASCLFKWWSTQGGSTCPYCRSPWST